MLSREHVARWLRAGLVAATLTLAVAVPASAHGATLLVLGPHGHITVRHDQFLQSDELTPVPSRAKAPLAKVARARPAHRRKPQPRTARSEIARLFRTGQISHATYLADTAEVNSALKIQRHLSGTRAAELGAVLANLHDIAAARMLTPSRLPVLMLTLQNNVKWWTTGPLLSSGQRVSFGRSQLVWEYYSGQGLELQELGSWGQVDWMFQAGPKLWPRMLSLVDELIPLAVDRGGGIAWEYYFDFDGGTPPWTSAMSQATALQALTQAYRATKDQRYLAVAAKALVIFDERPPLGVSVVTPRGLRYLLYSFDPGQAVINGFIQTLIGLHDYARTTHSPDAQRLFDAGDAEAQYELPSYDTGAWSYYQPGQEASLDYHQLVTDFLHQLCSRTHVAVYCDTADRFSSYLKTPPVLELLTTNLRAQRPASIWFRLSKIGRAGVTISSNGQTVFTTSGDFAHGAHHFDAPPFGTPGTYQVVLDGTDLAGNYAQTQPLTLTVK